MRILFVGEGNHDIGIHDGSSPFRRASGVIPILTRKIIPEISSESIAIAWKDIQLFPKGRFGKGIDLRNRSYQRKIAAAVFIYAQNEDCFGTICVVDQDTDESRYQSLNEAINNLKRSSLYVDQRIAFGVAVESVEAWTLGAYAALANKCRITIEKLKRLYPKGKKVEELSENSGKPEHRPKTLLQRLAKTVHEDANTDFRIDVASNTDETELALACPKGFGQYVNNIKEVFR